MVEIFKVFLKNFFFWKGPKTKNSAKSAKAKNILSVFSEPSGPKALRESGEYLELWKKGKITAP